MPSGLTLRFSKSGMQEMTGKKTVARIVGKGGRLSPVQSFLKSDGSVIRGNAVVIDRERGIGGEAVLKVMEVEKGARLGRPAKYNITEVHLFGRNSGQNRGWLQSIAPQENMDEYLRTFGKTGQTTKSPQEGEKSVVRKGYNPKTNKTQLIYSDGTKEIVDGKR